MNKRKIILLMLVVLMFKYVIAEDKNLPKETDVKTRKKQAAVEEIEDKEHKEYLKKKNALRKAKEIKEEESKREEKEEIKSKKTVDGIRQVELPVIRREKIESGDKVLPSGKIVRRKVIPDKIKTKLKKERKGLRFNVYWKGRSYNEKYLAVKAYKDMQNEKVVICDGDTGEIIYEDRWESYKYYEGKSYRISNNGAMAIRNGSILLFLDKKSKIKKKQLIKTSDFEALLLFDIKGENLLVLGPNRDISNITLYNYNGDLLWQKEFEGKLCNYPFIFSKNMRYFAFEVKKKNTRPKTVVMDIDGNVVREIKSVFLKNVTISDNGKYLAAGSNGFVLYNLETGNRLWMNLTLAEKLTYKKFFVKHPFKPGIKREKYYPIAYKGDLLKGIDISPDGSYLIVVMVFIPEEKGQGGLIYDPKNEKAGSYIYCVSRENKVLWEQKFKGRFFSKGTTDFDKKVIKVIEGNEVIELDFSNYMP